MEIVATGEKGQIAIILNEEEVKNIINLTLPGIVTEVKPEVKKIKEKVVDPMSGVHSNNKEFITALYQTFGEGYVIEFSNEHFIELRRTNFVLNPRKLIQKLHDRKVVAYDPDNKSFMFMKSPLLSIQSA